MNRNAIKTTEEVKHQVSSEYWDAFGDYEFINNFLREQEYIKQDGIIDTMKNDTFEAAL